MSNAFKVCRKIQQGISLFHKELITLIIIIIIIMVIFKCYFSGELIALSYKKKTKKHNNNNNGVNIELGKNKQIKSTVHDANKK